MWDKVRPGSKWSSHQSAVGVGPLDDREGLEGNRLVTDDEKEILQDHKVM